MRILIFGSDKDATTFSITTLSKMDLIVTLIIKDTQHNDIQHNRPNCETQHKILIITTRGINIKCHYAECCVLFSVMLSDGRLDAIMLSVVGP